MDGALEAINADQPAYQEWMRCLRDRLTADFLQREGYDEQAMAVIKDSGTQYLVDTELIKQSMQISDALSKGNCQPALQWCLEHRVVLKKNEDDLEFRLRQQEFVELCRREEFGEALAYAKKHFVSFLDQHMTHIKQTLMLLAIPPTTEMHCYRSLYDGGVYDALSLHFKHSFNTVYILPDFPPLVAIIQAGLSALKTSACSNPADHHPECPVCNPPLSMMAMSLPAAHFESTHLVCRITGELMDDDNLPMVMPNGYAYSFNVSSLSCPFFYLGNEGDGRQMQWHHHLSKNRISMQIWGIAQVLHNMTFVMQEHALTENDATTQNDICHSSYKILT